ncbi:MAG: glycosyltransferase family 39 protein [Clostridium sp.]|nr:glycosyltransferase family 39 protein [Acetatifactor muris]MCM1526042.1 glycosyltransferase family 39 protein [Bacteroides sp.]MCM1562198.1 glycosyltransferase family 39 protein [Clostridium sp.]
MNKLGDGLCKAFYAFWTLMFGILCVVAIFGYCNHAFLHFYLAAGIWTILLLAVVFHRDRINAWSDRKVYLLLTVTTLIMFLLTLWAGISMTVPPFNDTATIYYSAVEVIWDGSISREVNEYTACYWATGTSNHDYFLVCPNNHNLFLVLYYVWYYKFLLLFLPLDLYGFSGYAAVVVLNALSIVGTSVFGFLAAKKGKDNTTAFLFLALSGLFVPYYLHAYKAYADTLSLPYVTMALYFYVSAAKEQAKTGKAVIFYILTGLSLAVGALVKGSVLILMVAMIIYTLVNRERLWKKLCAPVILLLVCVLVSQTWTYYKDHCSWIDTSESDRFELPTAHFLMMAAKGGGDYKWEDVQYSLSFPTYEERKQADTEEFIRRVKSHGSAGGYLSYQICKVAEVLADGNYAQYVHLEFTFEAAPALKEWVSSSGKYYPLYYGWITIYITLFYISVFVSAYRGIRAGGSLNTLLHICLCGALLFFSFWEFKSRYLLNFVPLFMLCTVFTLSEFADLYVSRGLHKREEVCD